MSIYFDNQVVATGIITNMSRRGANLALLLLGGFRSLVDATTVELENRGHPDVRPVHAFALRAIVAGAQSASELGRRLSVSKQAAAKTLTVLQERGYVASTPDPHDARRKRLEVTQLGIDVLREGEAIFDQLRTRWARRIGREEMERLEGHLTALVGSMSGRIAAPGWVAGDDGKD